MSHAILELVNKARFSELRGLEIDLVLDGCVVTQGEFLVETLFPDPVLDLERIECGDRESDVRQCECAKSLLYSVCVIRIISLDFFNSC